MWLSFLSGGAMMMLHRVLASLVLGLLAGLAAVMPVVPYLDSPQSIAAVVFYGSVWLVVGTTFVYWASSVLLR